MITKSDLNWEQHKLDVFEWIKKHRNEEKARVFIQYYASKYDKFKRSYLDYKLAYAMFSEFAKLNKDGTRWYAVVGIGGTGKSTHAKNIAYFYDSKFSIRELTTTMEGWVDIIDTFPKVKARRSAMIDEPDDNIYVTSREGKNIRKILGKGRQQDLFNIICATDLIDIPNYVFKKLNGIIFLPHKGRYFFFRNLPKQGSYIVQDIKRQYKEKGYKVFFDMKKAKGFLQGHTIKNSPFDIIDGKEYLKNKKKDYEKDIKDFIKRDKKVEKKPLYIILSKQAKAYTKKGKSVRWIADKLSTSIGTIQQAIRVR